MSFAVDANVLIYASDGGSPFHERARDFVDQSATGQATFYLTWPTVMAFVRIITNPAACRRPISTEQALGSIQLLLCLPHARVLTEQEGFLDTYRAVTRGITVRGNLVTDAHLAALLRQHGVKTLYTNDSDFRKFKFLDVRNPFDA